MSKNNLSICEETIDAMVETMVELQRDGIGKTDRLSANIVSLAIADPDRMQLLAIVSIAVDRLAQEQVSHAEVAPE